MPLPSPRSPCEAFSSPQRFWDFRLQRFPPPETFLSLPTLVSLMLFTPTYAVYGSQKQWFPSPASLNVHAVFTTSTSSALKEPESFSLESDPPTLVLGPASGHFNLGRSFALSQGFSPLTGQVRSCHFVLLGSSFPVAQPDPSIFLPFHALPHRLPFGSLSGCALRLCSPLESAFFYLQNAVPFRIFGLVLRELLRMDYCHGLWR